MKKERIKKTLVDKAKSYVNLFSYGKTPRTNASIKKVKESLDVCGHYLDLLLSTASETAKRKARDDTNIYFQHPVTMNERVAQTGTELEESLSSGLPQNEINAQINLALLRDTSKTYVYFIESLEVYVTSAVKTKAAVDTENYFKSIKRFAKELLQIKKENKMPINFFSVSESMQVDLEILESSADGATYTGTAREMSRYQGIAYIAIVGKGNVGNCILKAQQDTSANFSNAANLPTTEKTISTTSVADGFGFVEILSPGESYLRPVLIVPDWTAVPAMVLSLRFGRDIGPDNNPDGLVDISPGEGA